MMIIYLVSICRIYSRKLIMKRAL